jgi:hypothetical protein
MHRLLERAAIAPPQLSSTLWPTAPTLGQFAARNDGEPVHVRSYFPAEKRSRDSGGIELIRFR